jgi:hypothetical protein
MLLGAEEGERDMSAVELPPGQQVDHREEQPDPSGIGRRVQVNVVRIGYRSYEDALQEQIQKALAFL